MVAGSTCGLFTALTGVKLPGQATAVAEGNALGKGALVYHLFPSALQTIQARASGNIPAQCIFLHSCTVHLFTFLHSASINIPAQCICLHSCAVHLFTFLRSAFTFLRSATDNISAQCIWYCTLQLYCSLRRHVSIARA